MNQGRSNHGLIKYSQNIFTFGGKWIPNPNKSAEVYNIIQNSW